MMKKGGWDEWKKRVLLNMGRVVYSQDTITAELPIPEASAPSGVSAYTKRHVEATFSHVQLSSSFFHYTENRDIVPRLHPSQARRPTLPSQSLPACPAKLCHARLPYVLEATGATRLALSDAPPLAGAPACGCWYMGLVWIVAGWKTSCP